MAKDLEHALKLVRDRTSQDSFLLTKEAIDNLDAYLNRVIREYFWDQTSPLSVQRGT
jgi:hypothetical protein